MSECLVWIANKCGNEADYRLWTYEVIFILWWRHMSLKFDHRLWGPCMYNIPHIGLHQLISLAIIWIRRDLDPCGVILTLQLRRRFDPGQHPRCLNVWSGLLRTVGMKPIVDLTYEAIFIIWWRHMSLHFDLLLWRRWMNNIPNSGRHRLKSSLNSSLNSPPFRLGDDLTRPKIQNVWKLGTDSLITVGTKPINDVELMNDVIWAQQQNKVPDYSAICPFGASNVYMSEINGHRYGQSPSSQINKCDIPNNPRHPTQVENCPGKRFFLKKVATAKVICQPTGMYLPFGNNPGLV